MLYDSLIDIKLYKYLFISDIVIDIFDDKVLKQNNFLLR